MYVIVRKSLEQMFGFFCKVSALIESILNDCLGLPENFLKEFNHDRSWDFMVALSYFPATENENNGIKEHEDGNLFTFVVQDEAGGLEVCKNGEWIPVIPEEGKIVVNVADIIQVNSTFKASQSYFLFVPVKTIMQVKICISFLKKFAGVK